MKQFAIPNPIVGATLAVALNPNMNKHDANTAIKNATHNNRRGRPACLPVCGDCSHLCNDYSPICKNGIVGALPATPFQQPTPICNETPHIVRTSWRNGENHGKQQGNHRCTGATVKVAPTIAPQWRNRNTM